MQKHLIEYIFTLLGSGRDISESTPDKNAPSYSLDIAKNVRDFINEIPGGFLVYYSAMPESIIYANDALIKLVGCKNMDEFREHTKNSFRGFVHPDDVEEVENSITRQIANNVQEALDYVEYRVIRKDGSIRWVEDYGHFIHNDVLGDIFYVFISDMTEKIEQRKAREQFLHESNQRMESLVRQYDSERTLLHEERLRGREVIEGLSMDYESIFFVDLNSNDVVPYRLNVRTEKNFDEKRSARKFDGFTKEFISMWVHPDDRQTVARDMDPEYIKSRLNDDVTFYDNFRIYDGGIIHKQLRVVSVVKDNSEIVIGLRNVDDEIKESLMQKTVLENALTSAKRAAEAKNIFLSNMSHDMRTPLNAITGYLNLAKSNISDTKKVCLYLDKIEDAGKQILELTEKVLELTYAESQDSSLKETDCNICGIVSEVCDSLQKRAEKKDIAFVRDLSRIRSSDVIADAEKLKQIFHHLVDNAIKYTRTGGHVEVTLEETDKHPNGLIVYRFSVSDSGVGISKELLPRVFDPFERELNSTSSGVFGTGIGLTIAKNFTELMGGTISVDSELGKGSTFSVEIGLHAKRLIRTNEADAQKILEEIKNKKILIVEDNEINREIECEILEELGFSVDSAENGQIAIDMLAACPEDYYAVVLMDIQMPVLDGRQATKIIRNMENPVLSRIPIIAVSANAFESDKFLSEKAGIDAHLPKPLDVQLLIDTIANVVSARKNGQA